MAAIKREDAHGDVMIDIPWLHMSSSRCIHSAARTIPNPASVRRLASYTRARPRSISTLRFNLRSTNIISSLASVPPNLPSVFLLPRSASTLLARSGAPVDSGSGDMTSRDVSGQSDISKMSTEGDGSFKRKASSFRNTIEKGGKFEPEKGERASSR